MPHLCCYFLFGAKALTKSHSVPDIEAGLYSHTSETDFLRLPLMHGLSTSWWGVDQQQCSKLTLYIISHKLSLSALSPRLCQADGDFLRCGAFPSLLLIVSIHNPSLFSKLVSSLHCVGPVEKQFQTQSCFRPRSLAFWPSHSLRRLLLPPSSHQEAGQEMASRK